jgi:hypothetical protein
MSWCKPKTRHLAELSIIAFLRTYPGSTYFVTLTEPGRHGSESYWTKDEAEEHLKPFTDRLRRDGAAYLVFWELQKRGAWHPHLLISKRYDVGITGGGGMRDWLMKRGWGQQMLWRHVAVPPTLFLKQGAFGYGDSVDTPALKPFELPAFKLVKYLVKYLTKSTVAAGTVHKKLFGGSEGAKIGTIQFRWLPQINASSYLYYYGLELFHAIERRCPTFRDTAYIIRLGVENCDWLSVDPWWTPYAPPPPGH